MSLSYCLLVAAILFPWQFSICTQDYVEYKRFKEEAKAAQFGQVSMADQTAVLATLRMRVTTGGGRGSPHTTDEMHS